MTIIDLSNIVKVSQTECPCCGSRTDVVMEMPNYPVTELFRSAADENDPYGFIDQKGRYCSNCGHFFLENILDPDVIYSDSNYITSTVSSKGATDCLDEFYEFILANSPTKEFNKTNIVDIGGNDSYLLKKFNGNANRLVNIDPHASSDEPNIEIVKSFFEKIEFSEFNKDTGCLFASSHTFEHLEDPVGVLRSIAQNMSDNDSLFLQFPSIEKLVEFSRYDQICHQHVNLFSVNSVTKVLEEFGLNLNAYEYDTFHFGTIRLMFSKKGSIMKLNYNLTVDDILSTYNSYKTYYKSLNHLIEGMFINGQGFGAGLMVPTLNYHLPVIGKLNRIIDENPSRIGKKFINLSPPVCDVDHFDLDEPILITSISTKAAARVIFNKLSDLGFKDIFLPTIGS
jgi:hypothetical protein